MCFSLSEEKNEYSSFRSGQNDPMDQEHPGAFAINHNLPSPCHAGMVYQRLARRFIQKLCALFAQEGVFQRFIIFGALCSSALPEAWKILAIICRRRILLMKLLPGRKVEAPSRLKAMFLFTRPTAFPHSSVRWCLFYLGSSHFKLFSPAIIYDNFGGLLGALNFFSLLFCFFLYFKGRYKPSSTDSGTTGDAVFDYFWGMELYPRVFGWDVKMFTNCRFGMMGWGLIILSFAWQTERTLWDFRLDVGRRHLPAALHHQIFLVGNRILAVDGHHV